MSIHLSVALLKAGYRVATVDLDTRQRTLTRFYENRASFAQKAPWKVELSAISRRITCAAKACRTTNPLNSAPSPRPSPRSSMPTSSW